MFITTEEQESIVSLKEIARPIAEHLEVFDEVFDRSIRSTIPLVDMVARYIIRRKGKKVRPILVLLSAEMCAGIGERSYRGAALVEILHTATLIHDDVIDDSDIRRGFASINAIWKNKIAILMGDYLLAKGLLLCLDNDDFRFLKITSGAVKRMSEGEIYQIQKSRKMDMDEEAYLRIIGDKTASLMATCCEIGAASATDDSRTHELLRCYGEKVGLAFQIQDDLLDFTGRKSVTGKPTGLDMGGKKLTMPLIHALGNASGREKKEILGIIRNGGKKMGGKEIRRVIDFVREQGGLDYASSRAGQYSADAKEAIRPFPDSPSKSSLLSFADFVIDRDR
jgi:octaprenyl-diphosphate synthase